MDPSWTESSARLNKGNARFYVLRSHNNNNSTWNAIVVQFCCCCHKQPTDCSKLMPLCQLKQQQQQTNPQLDATWTTNTTDAQLLSAASPPSAAASVAGGWLKLYLLLSLSLAHFMATQAELIRKIGVNCSLTLHLFPPKFCARSCKQNPLRDLFFFLPPHPKLIANKFTLLARFNLVDVVKLIWRCNNKPRMAQVLYAIGTFYGAILDSHVSL